MKVLIIYFTMSGRTKKTAKAIGSALTKHEVSYLELELTGKFVEKIKTKMLPAVYKLCFVRR